MTTNAVEQTHGEAAASVESPEGDLHAAIEMANGQDWDDIGAPGGAAEAPANEDSGTSEAAPADGAGGEAEATTDGESTPAAEPPAPEAKAQPEDDLRAVAERAARRRAEAQSQQSAPEPTPQQPQQVDAESVAAIMERQHMLLNDPLGYVEKYRPGGMSPRQFYERMTQQATGRQPQIDPEQVTKSVDERIAENDRKWEARIQQIEEQRQSERQQAAEAAARRDFDKVASTAEHYPLLSALDESDRLYWGDRIAAQYNAAGESWDYAKVARTAEVTLRKMQERWAPTGDGAGARQAARPVDGAEKQGSAEPKTLTNAIAAESPGAPDPADMADWELLEDAKRLAETVDFDDI